MSGRSECRLPATAGDLSGSLDSSIAGVAVGAALPSLAGLPAGSAMAAGG